MTYDYEVIQDGQIYKAGEDVPDMGSVKCVKEEGNKKSYVLLSADIDKLPKYDDLASGSSALVADKSEVYVYESSSKTWYKQGA